MASSQPLRYPSANLDDCAGAIRAGGAVIERGAGTAILSMRRFGASQRVPLVRINPREAWAAPGCGVGLALGALAGLRAPVRELGDVLNERTDLYPPMPLPDNTTGKWTTRGVEMVLFMDGY